METSKQVTSSTSATHVTQPAPISSGFPPPQYIVTNEQASIAKIVSSQS